MSGPRTLEHPVYSESFDSLVDLYDRAAATESASLIVLHTPYGGGIEQLLKHWRRRIVSAQTALFEASCRPEGATYRPLRDLVAAYVARLDDIDMMDESITASVRRLSASLGLPSMLLGHPGSHSGAGMSQLQFYEELGQLFSMLSQHLPATLLFRDFHLADSTTRAALLYLFENVFTDPVGRFVPDGYRGKGFTGVVVVATSEAVGTVDRLREGLKERGNAHIVSLRRVEEEEIRSFLSSDDIVQQLMTSSGGSVDNLRELLSALPRKVEDLYVRRLERLGRAELKVLEALAILGQPSTPDLLLRVVDNDGDIPSLAELAEQRLIVRRVARGELLVDFPSPDNRQRVYANMSVDRRALLHGRVGALLEDRARLGSAVGIEQIAHHYLHSNVREKAVQYALEAAERLHISFAYQRAREILDALLPHVEDDDERRAVVLERLVDICAAMGEHDAALARIARLLDEAGAERQPALYRRRGEIRLQTGGYAEALEDFARARAATAAEDTPISDDEEVRMLASEAEGHSGLGDYDKATEAAQAGLELAKQAVTSEGIRERVRLTNTLGKVYYFRGEFDEAMACFEKNANRANEHNWPDLEVRALLNQGTIALMRRQYDNAETIFQRCLRFGTQAGNQANWAFCHLNLAVCFHQTLRYSDALDSYLRALATFKRSGNDLQFAVTAMNLGALYESLGAPEKGKALLKESVDVTERRGMKLIHGRALHVYGDIAVREGEYADAQNYYEAAAAIVEARGSAQTAARIQVGLARAAHGLGNRTLRDDRLDSVTEAESGPEWVEVAADRCLFRGFFALEDGRADEAIEPLKRALLLFEENDIHERIWVCRLYLALALAAGGDTREARSLLLSAQALIETIAEHVPSVMREAYQSDPDRRRVVEAIEALDSGHLPTLAEPAVEVESPARTADYVRWRSEYASIVGEDPRLLQIFRLIDRMGRTDSAMLIQGESGTGKELVAEAVHRRSTRLDGPFIKVNCAAFVETLLLSELFGHERGAFTGAMARKKGRFELADGGTLFLDEIGDISPNTQVALLRVLQEGRFERVGGTETVDTDVRLICATNRNLEEMVKAGTFRLDLYYRLKGVVLELPALRDRREDIPRLIEHFCAQFTKDRNTIKAFSRDAMAYLVRYSWPGNIRELENFVRSILLFVDGNRIELAGVRQFEDFFADGGFMKETPAFLDAYRERMHSGGFDPIDASEQAPATVTGPSSRNFALGDSHNPERLIADWAIGSGVGLHDLKRKLEIELIRKALVDAGGNVTRAAATLDMKRPRLSQIINGNEDLVELRNELTDKS